LVGFIGKKSIFGTKFKLFLSFFDENSQFFI